MAYISKEQHKVLTRLAKDRYFELDSRLINLLVAKEENRIVSRTDFERELEDVKKELKILESFVKFS